MGVSLQPPGSGPYAPLRLNVRKVSASVADAAHGDVILMDATAGAKAVNPLPTATAGTRVTVNKTDSSANAVTVTPASGTINGAASVSIVTPNESHTFVADGTNWVEI